MAEPAFDHERLDVYRLPIDYVAFSYRIAKSRSGVTDPLVTNGFALLNRFR